MEAGWSNSYVGIPFEDGGRDRAGLDCWGLVCIVHRECLSIELPQYDEDYEDTLDQDAIVEIFEQERTDWAEVDDPQPGDVVMMRILSIPCHVGIVVDSRSFLHVMERRGTCIERLSSPSWRNRVLAFYRHRSRYSPTRVHSAPDPGQPWSAAPT